MHFLALRLLIAILFNTQLLFGERIAHFSYQPKQSEVRTNQHEIASVKAKSERAAALCQDLEFVSNQAKLCDCSNVAHDLNQYELLKEALQAKEFTSIIKVTKHGLQRLIERGFTATEISDLVLIPDITRIQADGAKVFIKHLGLDKYNIMIYSEQGSAVVTAIRNTSYYWAW